jgi:hypothetical protein
MKTTGRTGRDMDIAHVGTENESLEYEGARLTLDIGAVGAGLIGLWGLACLVGGIVSAGGIGDLARAYMTAVTGG